MRRMGCCLCGVCGPGCRSRYYLPQGMNYRTITRGEQNKRLRIQEWLNFRTTRCACHVIVGSALWMGLVCCALLLLLTKLRLFCLFPNRSRKDSHWNHCRRIGGNDFVSIGIWYESCKCCYWSGCRRWIDL